MCASYREHATRHCYPRSKHHTASWNGYAELLSLYKCYSLMAPEQARYILSPTAIPRRVWCRLEPTASPLLLRWSLPGPQIKVGLFRILYTYNKHTARFPTPPARSIEHAKSRKAKLLLIFPFPFPFPFPYPYPYPFPFHLYVNSMQCKLRKHRQSFQCPSVLLSANKTNKEAMGYHV